MKVAAWVDPNGMIALVCHCRNVHAPVPNSAASNKRATSREDLMLDRRSLMLASIAAGVSMTTSTALGKAAQPATSVDFDVPAGACDCHTHIHGDPAKFPFFAGRVYTPEPASPEEMAMLHKSLHIERV